MVKKRKKRTVKKNQLLVFPKSSKGVAGIFFLLLTIVLLPLIVIISHQQKNTNEYASTFQKDGHDNDTDHAHYGRWTHGDGVTGLLPTGTNSSYYYLEIKATGPTVACEVYSTGDWQLDLSPDYNHGLVLATRQLHQTAGAIFITNATPGGSYRCRISNIGTHVQLDYAELNSSTPGQINTGICGGHGPIIDPNTGGVPVEPPTTTGMPDDGCQNSMTQPYPGIGPGPIDHDEYGVGLWTGGDHTITVTRPGILTASYQFGHTGTAGTVTLEDATGHRLPDGPIEPSSTTTTVEFAGAQSAIIQPGAYIVHLSGPAGKAAAVLSPRVTSPLPSATATLTPSVTQAQNPSSTTTP